MPRTGWLTILLICGMLPLISAPDARAWDNRLVDAVRSDDLELARHLLEDGFAIDVNDCNSKRQTPLSVAIRRQNAEMVKLLLERGAEFDEGRYFSIYSNWSIFSNYSIFEAVWTGNTEVVSILIDHGADVNATLIDGSTWTLLFSAVERADLDMVRLLVDRGARVDSRAQGGSSATTILHAAVRHIPRERKMLTDDPKDPWARIPVTADSPERHIPLKLVQLFLDRGADIHAENARGTSPYDQVCFDDAFRHRDEPFRKIRELLCRRHRESLPLRKDDQGRPYLEGWGEPVNGLVARVVMDRPCRLGDDKQIVHWELMNIGEDDFAISHFLKWTVKVTDETGDEPRKTEMFRQWGHVFGRSHYTQKEFETFPFHPGQTRRHEVDLRRYYHFDRPGTYSVAVSLLTSYWTDDPLLHETGPFPLVVTE